MPKPFNLEAALRGDPVVTRTGRKAVRVIHLPEAGETNKIVVVFEDGAAEGRKENGQAFEWKCSSYADLLMADPTPDTIDWSHVSDNVAYMKRENPLDHFSFLFTAVGTCVGHTAGFASYKRGTVSWEDSLVQRPEGV